VRLWLGQFNWPDRFGQINQVVRIPRTAEVVVRQRGPRSLDEVPQLEIRTVREMLQNGTSTPDQAGSNSPNGDSIQRETSDRPDSQAVSRLKRKDRMTSNEVKWLESALKAGLRLENFSVCEWENRMM